MLKNMCRKLDMRKRQFFATIHFERADIARLVRPFRENLLRTQANMQNTRHKLDMMKRQTFIDIQTCVVCRTPPFPIKL